MAILGAGTCFSPDLILTNLSAIIDYIYIDKSLVGYRCLGLSHTPGDCSVVACTLVGASVSLDTCIDDVFSRLIAS